MQWARTWWNCGGGSQPSKKPRSWWSAGMRDRADTAFSKTGTAGRGCQEAGIQERPECRASYSEFRSYRSAVGWAKPTGPAGACHRAGQRPDPLGRPDDRLRVPTLVLRPAGYLNLDATASISTAGAPSKLRSVFHSIHLYGIPKCTCSASTT